MSPAIAERYTLLREVGRGGMGAVWLGEDTLLNRPVALKRIGFSPSGPGDQAPDLVRAEREARLAAMINHPHVVSVYDLVESDDRQWLVMEYVDGTALSTLLDEGGPLPGPRAAAMLAQAADALDAAHAAGIIHRDVKPSNMLVTGDDQVKISDFGIAKGETDISLTQTGMVTGSPAYLAPEIASGRTATAASDVWSLGATLFHAVTGRAPYAVGDNVLGTLYRIVNEEPPRLPPHDRLAVLLEHTMATDPEDRWSMGQVRDYLRGGRAPTGTVAAPVAETTQSMPPPAASFLESATREPPPTRTGGHAATHAARPGRSRWLPAVTVAAAVALVALLAVGLGLLGGDDQDTEPPATADTASSSGRPSDSGSPNPSPSPSPSPSETPEPAADDMTSFVEGYLATVTNDPATAWERLTPAFQRASGGFEQYDAFWSDYAAATPRDIQADPDALTVSYTVDYRLESGEERTDSVVLSLEFEDGTYLIAAEP